MAKSTLTRSDRLREIKRLRESLATDKFTAKEFAAIRGKIGGLSGAEHPGRRLGGIRAAETRWGKRAKKS